MSELGIMVYTPGNTIGSVGDAFLQLLLCRLHGVWRRLLFSLCLRSDSRSVLLHYGKGSYTYWCGDLCGMPLTSLLLLRMDRFEFM